MPEPMTFEAANRWLAARVNVPTELGSGALALAPDFPATVRMHAFFSANVTETKVLDGLRAQIDEFVQGRVDVATARLRLKTWLSSQGVAPDDVAAAKAPPAGVDPEEWAARKRVSNLASTRRLDLVLRQNAGMAHALGNREVSMNPAVAERWPYFRYIARDDGRTRPTHAALNGLVLRKDDPFWATHTPPWEFGCRCALEDADEEDLAKHGQGQAITKELADGTQTAQVVTGGGQVVNVLPPENGFVFRPGDAFAEPNWDLVPSGPLGAKVRSAFVAKAEAVAAVPTAHLSWATPGKGQEISLHGVKLAPATAPESWAECTDPTLAEPPPAKTSKALAAGCVIVEPDGRVWVVSPKGGYGATNTFPKGKEDKGSGDTLQMTAARETWEESGIRVKIVGHLGDYERTTSVCRYYVAVRTGGAPWAATWESEKVHLVPQAGVAAMFSVSTDKKIAGDFAGVWAKVQPKLAAGTGTFAERLRGAFPTQVKPALAVMPPTKVVAMDAGSGLKRVAGARLGGSTGAILVEDEAGERHVLKQYHGNADQVRNEFLASRFYTLNNVPVAEARLVEFEGKLGVASRMLEGVEQMGAKHVDWAAGSGAVKRGFVVDAWLANWDVAGQSWDNLLVKPGDPNRIYRVDHGGALLYRAQGTPKGKAFGKTVSELLTLRDPGKNPQTARLFAQVDDALVAAEVRTFAKKTTPKVIRQLVADAGFVGDEAKQLASTLTSRRLTLVKWEQEFSARAAAGGQAGRVPSQDPDRMPARGRRVLVGTVPTEVRDLARKAAGEWTGDERSAVQHFTAGGYRDINRRALAGKPYDDLDAALDKMPGYVGISARGVQNVKHREEKFAKYKTGEWAQVWWKAYSSSSIRPGGKFGDSGGFVFMVENHGRQGAYVAPNSSHPVEAELLFPRDTVLRVKGWDEIGDRRILFLEESDGAVPGSQAPPPRIDYKQYVANWKARLPEDSAYYKAEAA